jgi:hypothetical protein
MPPRRALLLLPLLRPVRAASAPLDLPALMAAMAAVPERRARFREERRLAALAVPLVATGFLYYRRPDFVEKVTERPRPERLVVRGEAVEVETAAEGVRRFPLDQAPELEVLVAAIRAPLAGDLATLERAFHARLSGTLTEWQLDLAPREERVQRMLRQVRLRGNGGQVLETLSVQGNGDEFAMLIEPIP